MKALSIRAPKPKIRPCSIPVLDEINRAIQGSDFYRGEYLSHAASDICDGGFYRDELDDLIRRRLLSILPLPARDALPERGRDICGNYWTVDLTERAMRAFWPERMA